MNIDRLTEIIDEALLYSNDFNSLSDKDKFDASETLHKLTKQQGEHERWIREKIKTFDAWLEILEVPTLDHVASVLSNVILNSRKDLADTLKKMSE